MKRGPFTWRDRVTVTLVLDPSAKLCKRAELDEYITEALANWGGGQDPEHPLFHGVQVLRFVKNRKKRPGPKPKKVEVASAPGA